MKKISAIILAFCVLNLSLSCTTSKIITYDEMEEEDAGMEYLILHTPKGEYSLYNFKYTQEGIEGELSKFKLKNGFFIHVYSYEDIDLKVKRDTNYPYLVNKDDIKKIEYSQTNIGARYLTALGIVIGIIIIGGVIDFAINGIGYVPNWGG